MTSKEYIEEHLKQLKKDFDIAIKENLKEYANKLVEDIKQSKSILKDLEILEILKKDTHLCLYEFDLDDNWYDWYLEKIGEPKITREEYLKVQKWLEGED